VGVKVSALLAGIRIQKPDNTARMSLDKIDELKERTGVHIVNLWLIYMDPVQENLK